MLRHDVLQESELCVEMQHPLVFWQAIIEADYAVPAGSTVAALTAELLAALGATDPVLRDQVALSILADWLAKPGYYTHAELRAIAAHMGENLRVGIGEIGSDTVFLRSFSALILDCVVDYDTSNPFLASEELQHMLRQALDYLQAERDLRGYVLEKGWAHATAHTADLLSYLARNQHIAMYGLEQMLTAIANRVSQPVDLVYVYREEERLAFVVMIALRRNLLGLPFLTRWCRQLAQPLGETPWSQAATDQTLAYAYHNTAMFVQSVYLQLLCSVRPPGFFAEDVYFQQPPAIREALLPLLELTIRTLGSGFYPQEQANDPAI